MKEQETAPKPLWTWWWWWKIKWIFSVHNCHKFYTKYFWP